MSQVMQPELESPIVDVAMAICYSCYKVADEPVKKGLGLSGLKLPEGKVSCSDLSTICGSGSSDTSGTPSAVREEDVALEAWFAELKPVVTSDVKPFNQSSDPTIAALLSQVLELGQECFHEDCLKDCSKRGGWRLSLLSSGTGADALLLGFVVYRLRPEVRALAIAKLAVPDRFRRRGFARMLMQDLMQTAKKMPEIDCVSLASLPLAITFYQRLGFKKLHTITAKDDASCAFPGQVYMEFKTISRGAPSAKGVRRRR
eukprot:TRINITY_DN67449_c0_g1_i1.p1 TRINITY_DN67449_c0_g1~~TRINITY_DN67449_c0_g1_i1.p1  ORF type:complete len:259 (+),score=60.05 TRINITY_DN67449_c0_g1_i1:68-844(+)